MQGQKLYAKAHSWILLPASKAAGKGDFPLQSGDIKKLPFLAWYLSGRHSLMLPLSSFSFFLMLLPKLSERKAETPQTSWCADVQAATPLPQPAQLPRLSMRAPMPWFKKKKLWEKKKKKRVKIEFDTWGWKYLAMTCWVWLCWGRLYILQCSATTFLNPPRLALLGAPGWVCSKPEYSSWIRGKYSIRLCFFPSQTNFLGIKPQGHRTYIFWYPEQNTI